MKKSFKSMLAIFAIPLLLIGYEVLGIIVNHTATGIQTNRLRHNIVDTFPDTEIISVKSETGNTSGTGNHVDCLSCITFTSDLSLSEVQDKLSSTYDWSDLSCYVNETTTKGQYLFFLRKRAPFVNNIEGH